MTNDKEEDASREDSEQFLIIIHFRGGALQRGFWWISTKNLFEKIGKEEDASREDSEQFLINKLHKKRWEREEALQREII